MAKLISNTYGEALFELASEENKIDLFMEEVNAILQVLKENEEFGRLMNHPKILKEEKLQVIEAVLKGRVSDELVGFMRLLILKSRYAEIEAILEYFCMKVKELKGIGIAFVTTPLPLTEEQQKSVEQRLIRTTSYQQMEMHYQVDASLIGGMVIRIGDRVVDSSISTKLNELQKELMKIQLA